MILKKISFLLLGIVVCAVLLTGCKHYSISFENGIQYSHYDKKDKYYPLSYVWDGKSTHTDIYIPDTYKGETITDIGGYLQGNAIAFYISMSDDMANDKEAIYSDEPDISRYPDTEYETLTFTIYLGKNIKDFNVEYEPTYWLRVYEDYKDVLYKVEYTYVVDENNKYIEVKNGKLRQK